MPELMKGFFIGPFQENSLAFRERIKTLTQTSKRDDRELASAFSLAKDKIEAFGIEVDIGDRQNLIRDL
jgi:hypothetical protein